MIKYTLKCAGDHRFESWFSSISDFDRLSGAGMLSCPVCGTQEVEKTVMAPNVASGSEPAAEVASEPTTPGPLSAPAHPAEAALSKLRQWVENNSEDVGTRFASEARAMHLGETEKRSIHGQARPEDARALFDEGIPVAPLPWGGRRDS